MVDHFSYLTYVHLTRGKIEEESLSGKADYKRWAATFGFKINRYHLYNGIINEQPFRSAIEESNQTTTFCGVVSHQQNDIVENKIKLSP